MHRTANERHGSLGDVTKLEKGKIKTGTVPNLNPSALALSVTSFPILSFVPIFHFSGSPF